MLGGGPIGVQAVLNLVGLIQPDGRGGALTLRDVYILVVALGVLGRESATAQPGGDLARFAVAMADALLQARAAPEPARSIPSAGPPGPVGGGS